MSGTLQRPGQSHTKPPQLHSRVCVGGGGGSGDPVGPIGMNSRSWMGVAKTGIAFFSARLEPGRRSLWGYWEPSCYLIQSESDANGKANGVWSTVCSLSGDLSLRCGSLWGNHQVLWSWTIRNSWTQKDGRKCHTEVATFILIWAQTNPTSHHHLVVLHSNHDLPSFLVPFSKFLACDFLTSFK